MSHSPFAFATLLTTDSYLPGALTLAAALRDVHVQFPAPNQLPFKTVCLVTPETVDVKSIKALRKAFDIVVGVEVLEFETNERGLSLLGRPDLNTVLTKLHVFRLTDYSKIIFLDADVLPLQPLSHLFNTQHEFAAVPDVGWPDIFNSGVFVFSPGESKFDELMELVKSKGSWDGGDQGLLNEWRGNDWERLSFTYNTTPTAAYTYAPAYERYGADIKAIHFIGPNKPWSSIPWRAAIDHPSAESMRSHAYGALVDRWFAVYDRHYRPPIPITEAEYQAKRYESAWDTATFDPTAILDSHPTLTVSAGYDLSQLRRVAIEGAEGSKPVAAGEGEYKSMPLEGRVSLMRPEIPQVQAYDPTKDTSDAHQGNQSQSHPETAEEEPRPPGREGLPSYLYRPPARKSEPQPKSNWPPAPRHHDPHHPHHQSHHQPHHQPHDRPSHPHSHSQFPQDNKPSSTDQEPPLDPVLLYVPVLYPEQQRNEPLTPENQQQQGGSQHHPQEEYRPPSPPLITWNPAHEPPPHDPPPPTAWDMHSQHYSNVWDMPVSQQYRAPYHLYSPTYTEPTAQHHPRWSPPRQRSPQPHYVPTYGSPPSRHWDGHSRRSPPKESEYGQQQEHKQQEPSKVFGGSPPSVQSPHMDWQHHHYRHHYEQQQFSHIEHRSQQYEQPQPHHHHVHSFYDEPRPDGFFHAPPPAGIPTRLLKEGHYDNVLTDNPRPDNKKVKPIFPWENSQRPRSSRVFPDWDPKPPALATPPRPPPVSLPPAGATFPERRGSPTPAVAAVAAPYSGYSSFGPSPPQRTPSPPPPAHVQRKFNPPPEPPRGYAGQYANAWDEDPVIQKYASVLSGGKSKHLAPPSPAPWPLHQGQVDYFNSPGSSRQRAKGRAIGRPRAQDDEEWTNWAERAEASSRDGDDEDDEDEYIEEVQSPQTGLWKKEKRKRTKPKGSAYRSIGVQTDAIETKEVGVQVSMPSITTPSIASDTASRYASARVSRGAGGMEYGKEGSRIGWAMENLSPVQAEAHARAQRRGGTGAMSPRLHDPMAYSPMQRSPTRSPTGTPFRPGSPSFGSINVIKPNGSTFRSPTKVQPPVPPVVRPRVSSGDTVTTAADSTVIASPATDLAVDFPEIVEQDESPEHAPFPKTAVRSQQPSPTTAPPQSSSGTASPVRRRAGRVFDPARGVEVIKRTHEEVLTRFLKQGPTSWGEKDQKKQDPPTPSAVP